MDNIKTGQFIKELRLEKGLTQQDLANELKCTNKAISRWETGNGSPDIDFLAPLSNILGVTINELLAGEKIKENEILQKSDEVIIDTMKKSKKQSNRLQWIIFIISCLLQILITLWIIFESGRYDWLSVTIASLFIPAISTLISSRKLRFVTPVISVIIYSVFTFLAEETMLYIIFYLIITAIISQIVYTLKKVILQNALKKYKEKDKKTQKGILTVLILILVMLVAIFTTVILEYTHALWIWQDVNFLAPPTKQMLEEQPGKGSEDNPIQVYGNPKVHYFEALIFPWDSERMAMEKMTLTRQNNDISAEYLVEYGYLYGYFQVQHEVVETSFNTYKYWLKGSPNGAKWLVTVDCSGVGYNISYEKY